MTPEVEEQLEGLLLATGYDDCLLGIAERCGQPNVAAYDAQKIARSLMRQGMSEEEAWEFFYFNISGAYVGEQTPVFIHKLVQQPKTNHGNKYKPKTNDSGARPDRPAGQSRPRKRMAVRYALSDVAAHSGQPASVRCNARTPGTQEI